jgi:hypothetical protein
MFGYRFTNDDIDENNIQLNNEDLLLFIDKKKRLSLTKSYNKLSIIRLVQ